MTEQIRILHVDDEPDFADMTATFLEREDDRFVVETATDPSEGLDALRSGEYDCVVSDYDMPGTDGIEFLEQVRENSPDLPFVLFTGKGSEEVASDAISEGVTDYLQKNSGTEQYELLANRISNATERYLAQREADWHRNVIESMGEGVYVADSDHVLRFVNFRVRREAVPEKDLIGRPLSFLADAQILTEKEVEEVKEGIDRILDGETEEVRLEIEPGLPESEQTELRLRRFQPNGEDLVLGTGRDITEQKKREEELTRSRELLRHTEEIARTGGWELDAETGEERWTEGAYEIGEVPPDADFEPTLENSLGFYHPDDRVEAKAAIENCIESGGSFEDEFRLTTAEDRLRWAKVAGEPVTENGEVTRVRGAIQDITEHKSREKELRELKERLDLAVEGAELGVWDWDIGSGEIRHNERWAEMFGLPPEEGTVSVESARDRSHPEDVTEVEGKVEEALTGERDRYDTELRSMTADGKYKWVRTIGKVVERGEDGRAERVVGVNVDINELKERERELERQNQSLEEFASFVSHDLRSPLTVAKGRLELAQDDCDSEHLGDLEGSLDRMEDLIEDILALAREGEVVDEKRTVGIAETAEGCWQNTEAEGARLVTETDTRVLADPGSFKRLCENLVRNAVEHGGEGVTVTVGELEDEDRDGFYVADDGEGIPEEEHEEAFETGYSTSEDGTGIGLSVVERVAEAHGWEVELKESEAGGARFEISEAEVVE